MFPRRGKILLQTDLLLLALLLVLFGALLFGVLLFGWWLYGVLVVNGNFDIAMTASLDE